MGNTEDIKADETQVDGAGATKKKGYFGCLTTIVVLILFAVVAVKGSMYVANKMDPVSNNQAALKSRRIGTICWYISGSVRDSGRETVAEYVTPLIDKVFMQEESEKIGNEELLGITTASYTIDDEETVRDYIGQRVEITGKIASISGYNATLVMNVNADSAEEEDAQAVELYNYFGGSNTSVYVGECVKVEGYLIIAPEDFSDPELISISVHTRKIEPADYLALGGNPADAYKVQDVDEDKSMTVTQNGITLEIEGAIVDEATGKAFVKYRVLEIEASSSSGWDVDIFAGKSSMTGIDMVWEESPIVSINEWGVAIEERDPEISMPDPSSGNSIVFVLCGYTAGENLERDIFPNPDAELYLQVEIPSENWTIYSQ